MDIQNTSFGKLAVIPEQLLTNKFLRKCKKGEIDKILNEEIKIKPKKGSYLLLQKDELDAISKKKKNYKKLCYITLKERNKRAKILKRSKKYLPDKKKTSKFQKSLNKVTDIFKKTQKKLTSKSSKYFNEYITHIQDIVGVIKLAEYIEQDMYKYALRTTLYDILKENEEFNNNINENINTYLYLNSNIVQLKYKIKIDYALYEYFNFIQNKTNIIEELQTIEKFGLTINEVKNMLLTVYFDLLLILLKDKHYIKNYNIKINEIINTITEILILVYSKSSINKQLKESENKNVKQEIDYEKLYIRLLDIYKFNFFYELFLVYNIFSLDKNPIYNTIIVSLDTILKKLKPPKLQQYSSRMQTVGWFESKEIGDNTFFKQTLFDEYFEESKEESDSIFKNLTIKNIDLLIPILVYFYEINTPNTHRGRYSINVDVEKLKKFDTFHCFNNLESQSPTNINDINIVKFFIVIYIIQFYKNNIKDITNRRPPLKVCSKEEQIYLKNDGTTIMAFIIGNTIYKKIKKDELLEPYELKLILESIYMLYDKYIVVLTYDGKKYIMRDDINIKVENSRKFNYTQSQSQSQYSQFSFQRQSNTQNDKLMVLNSSDIKLSNLKDIKLKSSKSIETINTFLTNNKTNNYKQYLHEDTNNYNINYENNNSSSSTE